jgi:hypothetical protein
VKKPEPSRRQKWAPYVRDVADRLALKDWRVVVADDVPTDRDCLASVYCCEGRKIATIRFNDSFLEDTRDRQRHIVVHELVHAHLAAYVRAVEKKTNDDDVLALLHEYATDSLADAIAPLVPLPPIIK